MSGRGRATRNARGAAQGTWVSGGVTNTAAPVSAEPMEMEAAAAGEEGVRKIVPAWLKVGPDGKPIKRKPNPAKRNAMFRKHLQPKTAVMCLNELVAGLKYDVETLASVGNFAASVEVNGSVYRGYGSSKTLAKQAAAEAALVSFVKPPPPKVAPGEEEPVDETPWKTIASFAMYKLFAEWSEGNAGGSPDTPARQAMPGDLRNYLTEMQASHATAPAANVFAHGQGKKAKNPGAVPTGAPKPAKLSDEVKATQHPVMVVNQLHPGVTYASEEGVDAEGARMWTLTVTIGDIAYQGTGPNTKKAKFQCARNILLEAHGIDNQYQAPQ